MNLVERSNEVLSKVLGHYTELEVVRGQGSYLIGSDGKKYLDFASGIAVTSTGHCHPEIVKAAVSQTKKLIHNCAGVTYTNANIQFAEDLKQIVPIKDARFFLCQSGSESVEGALKAAKYVTGKSGIIALEYGFHGRTMGALSVTSSKALYTEGYGELMPNTFIAKPDINEIKKINNGNIAGIITELVQGEAGYKPQDIKFIQELRKYCTANNIFLIIDEVQSGFGRTGKFFACEWYGLEPDLIALSKGIASGFPLGAVVMKKEISEKWKTSTHGGTFTGNLVSCAAGSATIKVLKKELKNMSEKTTIMEQACDNLIKKYPSVFTGRQGLGFMIGLKLKNSDTYKKLKEQGLKQGLLLINCGPNGDIIRLAPPVTINKNDLKKGFALLETCAKDL